VAIFNYAAGIERRTWIGKILRTEKLCKIAHFFVGKPGIYLFFIYLILQGNPLYILLFLPINLFRTGCLQICFIYGNG